MIRTKQSGLSVLQSELLLQAGIPHGWFDSSLGNVLFRPGNPFHDPEWVDQQAILRRRAQACSTLDLDASKLVTTSGLFQTDVVQQVDENFSGKQAGPADAYVTNTPDLPIMLAAGDCTQTIVYAPDKNAMAIVHAGGLGTARAVLPKAVERLIAEFSADPHRMIAAIGPSVAAEHFVPSQKSDNFTLASIGGNPVTKKLLDGRIGYDIAATNVQQLREMGIPASHIEVSDIDTFLDHEWYSYERDKIHNRAAAMRRHGLLAALPQRHSSNQNK